MEALPTRVSRQALRVFFCALAVEFSAALRHLSPSERTAVEDNFVRNLEGFASNERIPMTPRDRQDFRNLVNYLRAQMTDPTMDLLDADE